MNKMAVIHLRGEEAPLAEPYLLVSLFSVELEIILRVMHPSYILKKFHRFFADNLTRGL
jgi:hypothetical protein